MRAYKACKRCLEKAYIPVIPVFLIFIFFSKCNTTEPPIDNTEPGRRDYVWTVDTLADLYSPRYSMWEARQHMFGL